MTAEQTARTNAAEHLGGYGQEFRGGKGFSGNYYRDAAGHFGVHEVENMTTGEKVVSFHESK